MYLFFYSSQNSLILTLTLKKSCIKNKVRTKTERKKNIHLLNLCLRYLYFIFFFSDSSSPFEHFYANKTLLFILSKYKNKNQRYLESLLRKDREKKERKKKKKNNFQRMNFSFYLPYFERINDFHSLIKELSMQDSHCVYFIFLNDSAFLPSSPCLPFCSHLRCFSRIMFLFSEFYKYSDKLSQKSDFSNRFNFAKIFFSLIKKVAFPQVH